MTAALFGTIWIALFLFALGETGRRDRDAGHVPPAWLWWAYAAGALLCAGHLVIAMAAVHLWSHASSVSATARQTLEVYGLNWGGGVWANYAFVALWVFEAWRWRADRARRAPRRPVFVWAVRLFFLVIILNAAVVFAVGPRRIAGAIVVLWLLWTWRPRGAVAT